MKDYNTRNNEENFPDGTVKAQDGKFFLMVNGKWEQVIGSEGKNLLQSPTDVAPMIINATITYEPPKPFPPLSPLLKREPRVVPRYSIYELEEIAKHILLYCKFRRRGCEDADSEDHKPQPL